MQAKITVILVCITLVTSCTSVSSTRVSPNRPAVSTTSSSARPISTEDAARITAFIRNQNSAVDRERGRGRGRNSGLPPGIARNLERGKPLPPGLTRLYLPVELSRTLPPLDRALEYVVVAGKLLIVETATQLVRDILLDALSV